MTGALVAIVIVLIAIGGATTIVVSYFRLQKHRADAVAMAGYRKLAEQAAQNQLDIHEELAALNQRVAAMEQMMRDIG